MAFGKPPGGFLPGTGTLQTSSTIIMARAVDLGSDSNSSGQFQIDGTGHLTLSGIVSGAAGLTVWGTGTLTLTNVNNSYTGGTFAADGVTLVVSADHNLGTGGTLTLRSATLQNTAPMEFSRPVFLGDSLPPLFGGAFQTDAP